MELEQMMMMGFLLGMARMVFAVYVPLAGRDEQAKRRAWAVLEGREIVPVPVREEGSRSGPSVD